MTLNRVAGSYRLYDARLEVQAALSAEAEIKVLTTLSAWDGVESVIDVGCGNGSFLSRLAVACPSVSFQGVDVDPDAIAAARSVSGASNLRFDCGSVEEVGQPADLMISRFCLLYVDDPSTIIDWCGKKVRIGAVQIDPADELWAYPASLDALEAILPGRQAIRRDPEPRTATNTTASLWRSNGFAANGDRTLMVSSDGGAAQRSMFLAFSLLDAAFVGGGHPPSPAVDALVEWYAGGDAAAYGVRLSEFLRVDPR